MIYDIVIKNGTIIDPKTRVQVIGNIGIKDGKIARITRFDIEGTQTINAKDRIVCPGFVDIHSHIEFPLHNVYTSVRQGITTALSGNCGMTPHMPIKKYLDDMETEGYPINWGTLIGHSWRLRNDVGLMDPYETASPEQIAKMTEICEQALQEGAVGLSLGLEYAPGATPEEYLPLCELAAKYGKLVAIHIRTDALDFAKGLREAIEISEKTGARVQISHLAYQFGVRAEVMDMALKMIDNAIERGLPILCDSGMYSAFATYIKSAVFDKGWNDRYGVPISNLMISTGKYAGQRATQEIIDDIRINDTEAVGTALVGCEADLGLAISRPYTMVSTDAGLSDKPGNGHPQDAGTYPKLIGKFVREDHVLSLMDAIYKSTYLPAMQLGIEDQKGWIGTGADADLVIFDYANIRDNAGYIGIGKPDAAPDGIDYVIVNGVTVVDHNQVQEDKKPGKIIRKENREWRM